MTPSTTVSASAAWSRSSASSRSSPNGDQLGDHRVVARADLVAFLDPRVDADARRQPEAAHGAGLRQERPRVLRVQARLDRVTVRRRIEPGEGLAVRDAKLELDEIEAGHRLGDRVLDLDPAVQLEEEDGVALDEELGRAGALVSERAREGDGVLGDPLPKRRRQAGRRGLLDDLLVAPLHRAVALSQREHRPVAVAHQLHLDVPRASEVALAVDRPVTEGGLGLARRGLEGVVQVVLVLDDPHPASASARGCLDEEREAELGRDRRSGASGRRRSQRSASPRACLRPDAGRPAAGRPTSAPLRRPSPRTTRSRRGSRIRGGRASRPWRAPPRRAHRRRGRTAPRPPRRRPARA